MIKLHIESVADDARIALPADVLERLHVCAGDHLYLRETPDGYLLSTVDAKVQRQMEAAEDIMREDRDVLRELAK